MDKMMMFFIPCEELTGGSIFTKLSANYNLVQPFVEKIDESFIDYLNLHIRNINYYIQYKFKSADEIQNRSLERPQNLGSFERRGDDK